MRHTMLGGLALVVALGVVAPAQQQQDGYLDIFVAKVKPEKRADFDAVGKKIAEANRRNNGDTWVAAEPFYGDWNTVYFYSMRRNYAEVETGFGAFMGALAKAGGGPAGGAKTFQDMNNCLVSSRGELRRRRLDLSSNFPADTAARGRLVGQSRWFRTVVVRVRPGHLPDYEQVIQMIRAARERMPGAPLSVAQSAGGQQGTVFYITTLAKTMGDFDNLGPALPQLLGQDGYQKYLRLTGEAVLGSEVMIQHFLPELSNAPEEVAAADPDYWRPKPPAAPKAKAKSAAPTGGSK